MKPRRVAGLADFVEEGWPSMERVAENFQRQEKVFQPTYQTRLFRPPYQPWPGTGVPVVHQAERFWNRFACYPRALRSQKGDFDLFHILDHSYAHLVKELPGERTVVTCHDTDAFRCLRRRDAEPRPWWFRQMTENILSGLREAAIVTCDSEATRADLGQQHGLPPDRLRVVPLGVDDIFFESEARLEKKAGEIWLLHVGSTIPRKRIGFLLDLMAEVRRNYPMAKLIRVGGDFTVAQKKQVQDLDLQDAIVSQPHLSHATLAELYATCDLTLLPSASEGFGFPILESLACRTPVLATDLPVLREAGGTAGRYALEGSVQVWVEQIGCLLQDPPGLREKQSYREWARQFTWFAWAKKLKSLYDEIV
jgi:glycosyltransferase involved in cell wall biosynthesis